MLIQFVSVLGEMLRLSVLWEIYCIYYFDILGDFFLLSYVNYGLLYY